MATFKKNILCVVIGVILATGGFFGGCKYSEYRIRKNGEQSITDIQSKLELAESKLAELQSRFNDTLQLAGKQREQLESIRDIISESKCVIAEYENELGDIDTTINSLERTVQRITDDFTKIQGIVESGGE